MVGARSDRDRRCSGRFYGPLRTFCLLLLVAPLADDIESLPTRPWQRPEFEGKLRHGGRGVCPSCNTRRMAGVAAHVTDHVLSHLVTITKLVDLLEAKR